MLLLFLHPSLASKSCRNHIQIVKIKKLVWGKKFTRQHRTLILLWSLLYPVIYKQCHWRGWKTYKPLSLGTKKWWFAGTCPCLKGGFLPPGPWAVWAGVRTGWLPSQATFTASLMLPGPQSTKNRLSNRIPIRNPEHPPQSPNATKTSLWWLSRNELLLWSSELPHTFHCCGLSWPRLPLLPCLPHFLQGFWNLPTGKVSPTGSAFLWILKPLP